MLKHYLLCHGSAVEVEAHTDRLILLQFELLEVADIVVEATSPGQDRLLVCLHFALGVAVLVLDCDTAHESRVVGHALLHN